MEPEPDEMEAAQIGALLGEMEAQRARGQLPFVETPLRLFGVGGGRFVRVLDEHEAPLSPRSLEAISEFLSSHDACAVCDDEQAAKAPTAAVTVQEAENLGTDAADETVSAGSVDEEGGDASSTEKETNASTDTQSDAGQALEAVGSVNGSSTVDHQEPVEEEEAPHQVATPQQLYEQQVDVGDWLGGGLRMDKQLVPDRPADATTGQPGQADSEVEPVASIWTAWPQHLEERRRIWFEAQTHTDGPRPVVYWLQSCFRVTQSNFALEAAVMLAQRLDAPLALVTLVRASVLYPMRHAPTASDAYLRWSLLEIQSQCSRANVAFHGITSADTTSSTTSSAADPGGWERHRLVSVLDELQPLVVVTDTAFDVAGAREMMRMVRHLELSRSISSWSLVAVDSASYAPVHNVSLRARGSLERRASFLSEEDFGEEYTAALARHGDLNDAGRNSQLLQNLKTLESAVPDKQTSSLRRSLQTRGLELVDWEIVRGMADESSPGLPTFTEQAGLQALSSLLAEVDHRPAIQAELQGGGVLSLLPFIRQGSLFSGHVIQRISEAIDFFPAPVTAQDRKALAMLKVMRSRALSHLAKERDYALYLSLWTATQHEAIEEDLQGDRISHLAASSLLLDSLGFSALIGAPLDAYARLLPSWIDNNISLKCPATGQTNSSTPSTTGPAYSPDELESASTQDAYWNAIQRFLVRHQYLHPLLAVYWAFRVLQWAVSARAGVATIDALVTQCAVGSTQSPDAVFMIWSALFLRLKRPKTDGASPSDVVADAGAFQRALERELASHTQLQLP